MLSPKRLKYELPSTRSSLDKRDEQKISYREAKGRGGEGRLSQLKQLRRRRRRRQSRDPIVLRARAPTERDGGARARCLLKVCAAKRTKGRGGEGEGEGREGKRGEGREGPLDVALLPRGLPDTHARARRPSAKGSAVARAPPQVQHTRAEASSILRTDGR